MKLALAASGLFIALLGIGIACGPTETYCYKEGRTCKQEEGIRKTMMMQSDAADAPDYEKQCPDPVTGVLGPCPG
jgi:hypothetical protein